MEQIITEKTGQELTALLERLLEAQGIEKKSTWLTPKQVEDEFPIKKGTLYNWKAQGKGPKYSTTSGKLCYRREWIEDFLEKK